MVLEVENITKKYGNQQVLHGITFQAEKGEIIGFLGPNGAGKTTTMKIITGILPPDSGTVKIAGLKISENEQEVKKQTGYLPENNPLYEEMYISEYLEYVSGFYKDISGKKERIAEVIRRTGLHRELRKTIGKLSKGYKQRVGFAQAILHNPGVLILDEPTSGLDPNQAEEMLRLLQETGKEKTVLFSSHILSEVESVCTRIILIHEGKILVDKPKEEIEDLEKLFKTQTKTG